MTLICGSFPAAEDACPGSARQGVGALGAGPVAKNRNLGAGVRSGFSVFFSAVQPVEKVAFNEVRENVRVNDIPIHLFEALGLRDVLVEFGTVPQPGTVGGFSDSRALLAV